jgi:DNA invertase Pin-like site-specific DNA recombinase
MIAKPKKRIAAYFRRSTKDKSQENSIERQQRALEHWLNSNSSEYELAGDAVFIEDGVSGDDSVNRPAFNRMLDLVKTGSCPFDSIFVSAVDRYGRFNALRCESYIYPLVENEIELVTPEKTYQWDEQGTGLHYLIFSSFSHQDNENRSAKTVQGIASKIANCLWF